MKFIYIDESGDFGFSKKSTKNVIIAASFTSLPKEISIWMKRIRKRKLNKKLRKLNELKAANAKDDFLKYFYQHANSDLNFSVYAVIINKTKIPLQLRDEEGIVFLRAIEQLVDIAKEEISPVMYWYFDRRPIKKMNWSAIGQIIKEKLLLLSTHRKPMIEIHPADSARNINIQFADFIAYALGCFVNHKDNSWYKIIKPHIKKMKEVKFKKQK